MIKQRFLSISFGLIFFVVLIFAVIHAASYGTHRKLSPTQKQASSSSSTATGTSVNPQVGTTATSNAAQSSSASSSPATTPTTTPSVSTTATSSSGLVNTGPGNILALFTATATIGYVVYLTSARHKLARLG